jgi:hypothetical protein
MGLAPAALAAEVHLGVASPSHRRVLVVARPVALERRPRFEQRAVHREVLGRQQLALPCFCDHLGEEGARHVVREQALAVLREARGVEAPVGDIEVEEPFEEEVVAEALTELAFGADRVQRDQQARLEQMLGRDRRPAALRVHRIEAWREPRQHALHDQLDAANRVIVRDELVRRQRQEHLGLLLGIAAHRAPPRAPRQRHPTCKRCSERSSPQSFSAPC